MKILLFLIAIALVGIVLYLGYKMDKKEEQYERKVKYNKSANNLKSKQETYNTTKINKLKNVVKEKTDKIKSFVSERKKEQLENKVNKIAVAAKVTN